MYAKSIFSVAALALPLAGITACSSTHKSDKDTLVTVVSAPVQSLNPLYSTDANSQHINELTHASLLSVGPDLKPAPYLAKSYRILSPTLIEIHLRPNCTFASGRVVAAEDVKKTVAFFLDEKNQSNFRQTFSVIKEVEIKEPQTLWFHLTKPAPSLTNDLELLKILDLSEPLKEDRPKNLSGAGPYQLRQHDTQSILLERRQQPCLATPPMPKILIKTVRDDLSRYLKLLTREVDVVLNELNYRKVDLVLNDPTSPLRVTSAPSIGYSYLGLNLQSPALRDVRIRQAIALSFDIPLLIKHKSRGMADQGRNILADVNFYANPKVPLIKRDLEKAKQLLAEAGYGPSNPLTLTLKTTTSTISIENAKVLAYQAAQAGIKLRHQALEWGIFYADVKAGNTELYQLRWVGVTDPRIYFENFHSSQVGQSNRTRYTNQAIDELTTKAESEMQPERRKLLYDKAQEIIGRDLPYISLWYGKNVVIYGQQVKGVVANTTGSWRSLLSMSKE